MDIHFQCPHCGKRYKKAEQSTQANRRGVRPANTGLRFPGHQIKQPNRQDNPPLPSSALFLHRPRLCAAQCRHFSALLRLLRAHPQVR